MIIVCNSCKKYLVLPDMQAVGLCVHCLALAGKEQQIADLKAEVTFKGKVIEVLTKKVNPADPMGAMYDAMKEVKRQEKANKPIS